MQSVKIRPADDPPEDLKPWPMGSHIDAGPLPTLEQLGVQGGMLSDPHAVANKLRGGVIVLVCWWWLLALSHVCSSHIC